MSVAQILETLTTSQEKVLETLKEAADILCNYHTHNMAPLEINQGEVVELYSLTIDCGEGDIIWQVEMWPNCCFKTIKRCKRVTIPNVIPTRPSLPFLQPRHIWGEAICNEILQLIRIADPRQNWWRDDSVFKNDEPADVYYFYHPGYWDDLQLNQPRTIQTGYRAFVIGDNLPSYYHTSERFIQLPSTGN
ncbi:hypothetical protein B9Z19DRAFT_1068548 [Tuber borchii]|uniref:Uncharacterized protein n=1 Tax=Tuber borchii TaxID=42251 RepID=A0A2T6ZF17_TUBBO|nr:hypothetical protein B9Z19DRAFT_1068548 [Tuber borchii]